LATLRSDLVLTYRFCSRCWIKADCGHWIKWLYKFTSFV